jgi:DNA helicase IV
MQVDDGLALHIDQQIEHERQQVEAMYDRLDVGVGDALASRARVLAAPAEGPQELYARDLEVARLTRTVSELRAADRALCFGRVDSTTGESLHVGRIGLRSEDGELLLVDCVSAGSEATTAPAVARPPGGGGQR